MVCLRLGSPDGLKKIAYPISQNKRSKDIRGNCHGTKNVVRLLLFANLKLPIMLDHMYMHHNHQAQVTAYCFLI